MPADDRAPHRLWIAGSRTQLVTETARRVIATANLAVAERGRFSLALSTGGLVEAVCKELGAAGIGVDPKLVHVFFADGRIEAPPNGIFFRGALDRWPVPQRHIHRPPGAGRPDQAARDYQGVLARHLPVVPGETVPRLDLLVLELGTDGRVAGIAPGSPLLAEGGDHPRWVAGVELGGPAAQGGGAHVTFTLPLIRAAQRILLLAADVDRSELLHAVLKGPVRPLERPAQAVRLASGADVEWLVDRAVMSSTASRDTLTIRINRPIPS